MFCDNCWVECQDERPIGLDPYPVDNGIYHADGCDTCEYGCSNCTYYINDCVGCNQLIKAKKEFNF